MERWLLLLGIFVVAVGLFLPGGLAGALNAIVARLRRAEAR